MEKYNPPNLQRLAATGVRAEALQPCFPTYTFPNHYTIVTGLYPAHHGIVANEMYDPVFNAMFVYKDPVAREGRWWGGEPIWVTAQKQGQRTANLYWPGGMAFIEGVRPDYWEPFDASVPPSDRVDKILGWLDLPPERRPTFLALYFDRVDKKGHDHGPNSPQVRDAILNVDAAIGRLLNGLRQRGIGNRVNIIVISDHGMAPTSPERVIFLDDYFDLSRSRVPTKGSLLTVWPPKGQTDTVFAQLRRIPHLRVYRRENVPAHWHYSGNRRIAPIIGLAEEGWTPTTHEHLKTHDFSLGQHGFDNNLRSMQAIFIAQGPAFKAGTKLPAFPNVDVYDLMAYLLHLEPARNDGRLDVFRPVLVTSPTKPSAGARVPHPSRLCSRRPSRPRLGAIG